MIEEQEEFVSGKRRSEEVIIGACSGSDTPDLWFIDDMGGRRGAKTQAQYQAKAREVNVALAICKSCDRKVECLAEGMRPENINYGIWGGLMAGERLQIAGERVGDHTLQTPQGQALDFLSRLGPYLRR